jgi:hypothetical protein
MPNLTPKEAQQIADDYAALAKSISDYIDQNRGAMKPAQIEAMTASLEKVVEQADTAYNNATALALENSEKALSDLDGITRDLEKSYKQLKDVQKAIDIAAAVVTLGLAIAARDPKAVAKAIGGIWKSAKGEEEKDE